MNTESIEQVRKRDAAKDAALRPMRAFYFDRHSNTIGNAEDGEPVESVGDAKARGRRIGARGFRIWLGKEAEESDGPTQLFYIQPWYGARYQNVHREGFFRVFDNIIKLEERRQGLQFMRRLTDPAYKEEVSDDEADERGS